MYVCVNKVGGNDVNYHLDMQNRKLLIKQAESHENIIVINHDVSIENKTYENIDV